MSESNPLAWKGNKSQVIPVETIDKISSEELVSAERQMEVIATSLRDLAYRVEEGKPDYLVFLDLSARLLATPYQKYLNEKMGR